MLPARLVHCSVREGRVWPRWLGEADHPWLAALLDELVAAAGQPERLLDERILGAAALAPVPAPRRALALHVARGLVPSARGDRTSRRIREALFPLASWLPRVDALAATAISVGIAPEAVEAQLFADLPGERPLGELPAIDPVELTRRVNLRLAQALVARSMALRIRLVGRARAVVRHAKLRGLLCVVTGRADRAEEATLHVSGPLSLFHHTLVYGRALGELLPHLGWCERFSLEARCVIRDEPATLVLCERDPLFPAAAPRRFDSKLEARFARALCRRAPDWELVREPAAIPAGDTLCFPDFALRHRPSQRAILVEIVGFWTADYLARKRAQLVAAGRDDLLVCVDETLACDDATWPEGLWILPFRGRLDPAAVLAAASGRLGIAG